MAKWISPAGAVAMLSHDPAGGSEDFGFSTLQLHGKQQQRRSVSDLVRAKLQPREPTAAEADAESLPVTAYDHRLVLAPLVADTSDIEQLYAAYDAQVQDRLTTLAIVLTMKFGRDELVHDMMSAAIVFVEMVLARKRRLTSLVVLHMPSDGMSPRPPHIHVVCTSRVHRPAGFAELHPAFEDSLAEIHAEFRDEWRGFKSCWDKLPGK
jgi:hypothetical protein